MRAQYEDVSMKQALGQLLALATLVVSTWLLSVALPQQTASMNYMRGQLDTIESQITSANMKSLELNGKMTAEVDIFRQEVQLATDRWNATYLDMQLLRQQMTAAKEQSEAATQQMTQIFQDFKSLKTNTVSTYTFKQPGSYNYTPRAGVRYVFIRVCGGGGGGGSAQGERPSGAGGGGAGGYAEGWFMAQQLGAASLSIVVGAGGAGGAQGGDNGHSGSTSSVDTLLSASGGIGGAQSSSAQTDVFTANGGGAGGMGVGGDLQSNGEAGGLGVALQHDSNHATSGGGSGGSSAFGGGPAGPVGYGAGQTANASPCAGGSGAASNAHSGDQSGGRGSDGMATITEFAWI